MLLQIPQVELNPNNSSTINPLSIRYPMHMYGYTEATESISTLKVVAEEIEDLMQRFAVVYPSSIEAIITLDLDKGLYIKYRCIAFDESTGITRGILERLGYELEESDYAPFSLYWITLRTRTDIKKTA
ncbi:hypothetical protein [Priestia megaterium]|uniref:hypothetical protein n=1 Tax=Priestia megaterium TaxID=1404 RepID=UPI000BFE195C|nr:hypothetical protein [Priestia megaterium]PGQ88314.1 hypothetical protein COA18_05130 [Priestia megaterium]